MGRLDEAVREDLGTGGVSVGVGAESNGSVLVLRDITARGRGHHHAPVRGRGDLGNLAVVGGSRDNDGAEEDQGRGRGSEVEHHDECEEWRVENE